MDLSKVTTPGQQAVVESLQRAMESYDSTLTQFGTKFKSIQDFANSIRSEAGNESKKFSDIMQEYGNAIANKVSDKWLKDKIGTLGEDIKGTEEVSGNKIPVKSVPGISSVKLPPGLADVITKAVRKVHPPASPDAYKIFTAVNNTLRGLWATGDASFVGIQQLPTWADNPALAAKIVRASFDTLKDPTSFAKWSIEHDNKAYGVRPTITKWIENGLHIAQDTGAGTDLGGLPGKVKAIPIAGKLMGATDRLFAESGNTNRVALADYLYDNYKNGGIINGLDVAKGATEADILTAITKAANRATGYADTGLGGSIGSSLLFAPRFLQSQLETVVKAASDGGIEGQVARRQLIKMTSIGIGITVAANAARGEDTVFDPRDSNFLRIRNVGGADLSVFGPWDTLVRGMVNASPHIDQNGDFTFGDPKALIRSKLSPVISTAVDLLTGSNVIGQKVGIKLPTDIENIKTDVNFGKNLSLPFALRNIGQEPATISAAGILGVKGSPLTGSEQLDNTLANAGITKSDPDYLIKRKDYLAQHPDAIPAATSDTFKQAQSIQQDIATRRKANDDLAQSGGETLAQFKDNRSTLLQEQRDKLSVILGQSTKGASSKQQGWLNSYFKLFDQNQDPITHKVDSTAFDIAVAKWTNDNGGQALDFVNRYMGTGLNTVESAYYNDLRKLDAAGYFNIPQYQNMHSGLTDDQINSYKQKVDAARAANPALQSQPYATTVQNVLSDLPQAQRIDIANSNKSAYQSKALANFKSTHRKELMWFNPNADWNSYQSTVNNSTSTVGKGTVKFKLKTALK
jgi:hypothetical protein